MSLQPAYFAVIPADVRYADIPANAKLLYGEITALCNKEGYCWASNAYFAELYNVNVTTVSEWIRALKELGVIDYTIEKGKNRSIVLREKPKGASGKAEASASEKAEHNNTEENNTKNKTPEETPGSGELIRELIDLFQPVNPSYRQFFKNKTQRAALLRLIFEHGEETIRSYIQRLPETNKMDYTPRITSPYELEMKLGRWLLAINKKASAGFIKIS